MKSTLRTAAIVGWLLVPHGVAAQVDARVLARGEYLFRAAGCQACHTASEEGAKPLAGGRAFETPFGVFYSPNITPDRENGIGAWSDADFVRALREGRGPDGRRYYPVFPYTSYTHLREADMLAIKAYLFSLPPVAQPDRPHQTGLLASGMGMRFWRLLFFRSGELSPDSGRSPEWNRGAYLVRALAHCGECHSPRNFLGAVNGKHELSGNPSGPDGKPVPNITPDREDGIGRWSDGDLADYLKEGLDPDGDVAGGAMAEVIEQGLSFLSKDDIQAIIVYLRSVPAQPGAP
ncbi:MAG: cytochrome c [Gammaproteobacteria bacterium]|nr:cytochrome c [Gammaproteobacteria bacterium]